MKQWLNVFVVEKKEQNINTTMVGMYTMSVWADILHVLIVGEYLIWMILKMVMQEMDFVQNVHRIIKAGKML